MRRWGVGLELHHQLLLSVHQPAPSAGFWRMTINERAVLVGHGAESGEHPDQTGWQNGCRVRATTGSRCISADGNAGRVQDTA